MPKKKNFLGGMQNYNPNTGEYEPALVGSNGEKPSSFKSFNKPKSELEKANDKRMGKGKKEEPKEESLKENVKSQLTNKQEESPKKYFKHPQVDGVWHDTGETEEKYGNKYKIFENEDGHKWGVTDSFIKQFEEVEEPKHAFKLDKEKYPDVEETPYGFAYNVGNQTITDLKAQDKAFGRQIDENKDYGFTLTVDGDEVYYDSFDEAYAAAKQNGGGSDDEEGVGKIIKYQPLLNNKGNFDYGEDIRAKKLNNGLAMETKKSSKAHTYFGSTGQYKLVDIESGTTVGWANSYEEALKKSKDKDFIGAVERARASYWNRYPERKRTPTDPEVIKEAKKIQSSGDEYTYQMLDRLRSDVEYVFGRGGKGAIAGLWYDGNPTKHIALMKELYKGLKEKPEWLTMEQIKEYENKFKELED